MEWIRTDKQIPLLFNERKLWFYNKESGVFSGHLPSHLNRSDQILDYLNLYKITHWMKYIPEPPQT